MKKSGEEEISLVEDWTRRGWKTCLELSEFELSERAELAGNPFERQPFFTLDIDPLHDKSQHCDDTDTTAIMSQVPVQTIHRDPQLL